jgi:hypothetical protein
MGVTCDAGKHGSRAVTPGFPSRIPSRDATIAKPVAELHAFLVSGVAGTHERPAYGKASNGPVARLRAAKHRRSQVPA